MHSLARLALGLGVLSLTVSCKGKDGASGSAAPGASASAGSAATTTAGAFEGAITMQSSSEHRAPLELTFVTKADRIRLDVPAHNGQMAHSILDPVKREITVLMDQQKMAMTMALPQATAAAGQPQAEPTITKTGKHETIAGHDCEDWNLVEPNGKHTLLCMADGMAFFDFSSMAPPGSAAQLGGSWMKELKDKGEFPLKAITTDASGKEESQMLVTKIDPHPVDDSLFAIPAGYKTMQMPAMPGGFPGGPGGPGVPGMPPGMGAHPGAPHR
jgi:hypothetical protein